MHMTKKFIVILLALGMICAVMAGCDQTPENPDTPKVPGSTPGTSAPGTTESTNTESPLTQYGNYSTEQSPIVLEENYAQLIQHSAETFYTGSSYSEEKLSNVHKIADYIANYEQYVEEYDVQEELDKLYEQTGFTLDLGFGAAMIKHYLGMTGETYDYTDRMQELLEHPKIGASQSSCISAAMKAAENLVADGQSGVTINQTKPMIFKGLKAEDGTVYYAFGSYHTVADMTNVQRTGDTFSATVTFRILDYYDWAEDSTDPEFTNYLNKLNDEYRVLLAEMVDLPTLESFCQADLAQLHYAGLAQDFMAHGSVVYNVTWTAGQSFDQATVTPVQ